MNESTHANDIDINEWYIHCPEPDEDQIYRVCRTYEDMWVTLREEFDTLEDAQAYALKLRAGEIRLSNVNA